MGQNSAINSDLVHIWQITMSVMEQGRNETYEETIISRGGLKLKFCVRYQDALAMVTIREEKD